MRSGFSTLLHQLMTHIEIQTSFPSKEMHYIRSIFNQVSVSFEKLRQICE